MAQRPTLQNLNKPTVDIPVAVGDVVINLKARPTAVTGEIVIRFDELTELESGAEQAKSIAAILDALIGDWDLVEADETGVPLRYVTFTPPRARGAKTASAAQRCPARVVEEFPNEPIEGQDPETEDKRPVRAILEIVRPMEAAGSTVSVDDLYGLPEVPLRKTKDSLMKLLPEVNIAMFTAIVEYTSPNGKTGTN